MNKMLVSRSLILQASQNQYFDAMHKWMFINNETTNKSNNRDDDNSVKTITLDNLFENSINKITNKVNTTLSMDEDQFMLKYKNNNDETDDVFRILENLNLSVDTDIIVAVKTGESTITFWLGAIS